MKQQHKERVVYLLVTLIVVGFMFWAKPVAHFSPQGILLPFSPLQNHPTQSTIALYRTMPADAKKVGIVFVQYHQKEHQPHAINDLQAYAKTLAANAGATGLVLYFMGYQEQPNYPMLSGYEFVATAIRENGNT